MRITLCRVNWAGANIMKRILVAGIVCVTAVAWAGPAVAQTATVVSDLPKGAFQALQTSIRRKANGQWGEAEARAIRTAVMQDGKVEASEAAALAELRKGAFNFTIRVRPDPAFTPNDVVLQGTLNAAGIALLDITDADAASAAAQRADETRVAFLIRRGTEKVGELAQLVASDAKAKAEARTLIARRFSAAYEGALPRGVEAAVTALRETVGAQAVMGSNLSAADKASYDALLQEAAVVSSREKGVALIFYAGAFGGAVVSDETERAIAKRIGLN